MIDIRKLESFLISQISIDTVKYLISGFLDCYHRSKQYVDDRYEYNEAIDILPHIRRAEIETFLKSLPNRFDNFFVQSYPNKIANCYHVEVRTKNLIFTQSFNKNSEEKIREAHFRNSLKEFNKQFELFDNDDGKVKNENNYYGILTHGSAQKLPDVFEFMNFVFPSFSENEFGSINLIKLSGSSIQSMKELTIDVEDQRKPSLREDSLKKNA